MRITVLGAGAWGTALARHLRLGGHPVVLWSNSASQLELIRATGRNEPCLPGIDLPRDWELETDVARALHGSELAVVAIPSKPFRQATVCLRDFAGIVVSVTKGIEYDSGLTMSDILAQNAPRAKIAALSGPTLALEVARGVPTAIVAASHDAEVAKTAQALFHRQAFRVYTSKDLMGVELGGALKNVIAIAAGVCDGMGLGDNSKAALITRAIVEMRRLGVARGARPETFSGLSGLGDLTVTCFSRLSRNRGLGERLGKGEKLEAILNSMSAVAEGYPTARSAVQLARKLDISVPIMSEVYAVLFENKEISQAVRDLYARESKPEEERGLERF
jgi:glycerol-3-phosphate dehydrogenase (NAD(P)+)